MKLKVFISSTIDDLKEHREKLEAALTKIDIEWEGYEKWGTSDKVPIKVSLDKLAGCNYYIGIIGHCYGGIPEGFNLSFTELEYKRAKKMKDEGDMILKVYLAKEDFKIPVNLIEYHANKRNKLKQFKEELLKNHTIPNPRRFSENTDEFVKFVVMEDLHMHKLELEMIMNKKETTASQLKTGVNENLLTIVKDDIKQDINEGNLKEAEEKIKKALGNSNE